MYVAVQSNFLFELATSQPPTQTILGLSRVPPHERSCGKHKNFCVGLYRRLSLNLLRFVVPVDPPVSSPL